MLFSKNKHDSTEAQKEDPGFTSEYDVERERLFYDAINLNKEFILSSKSISVNLLWLSYYWKFNKPKGKQNIKFIHEDLDNMVPCLFQTLFLIVPVLSSTFASIGNMFKDIKKPGIFGTLIIDEAGQAVPQAAVGSLYRCRQSIIVGDPQQIKPVVTDDLDLLKTKLTKNTNLEIYSNKLLSCQGFADSINRYGTYLPDDDGEKIWVGSPLLMHRRSLSPIFDISNLLSYDGMMRNDTSYPSEEKSAKFIFKKTQWLNVIGTEIGSRDHFVEKQAEMIASILKDANANINEPDVFIISPFKTVVSGLIRALGYDFPYLTKENQKRIGTVHTFQGREAAEVIFVLGCDNKATGAISFVDNNIVNVACSRAKYRICIIGDERVWKNSEPVMKAKRIIDTYAISKMINDPDSITDKNIYRNLPSSLSFTNNDIDKSNDTSVFINELSKLDNQYSFSISDKDCKEFGFKSKEEVLNIPNDLLRSNITYGIYLYQLFAKYQNIDDFDYSCCGILFCKAMELQMHDCFDKVLVKEFPETVMRDFSNHELPLKDFDKSKLTLGAYNAIIQSNLKMMSKVNTEHDSAWWNEFCKRLNDTCSIRNKCCHSEAFRYSELGGLIKEMFKVEKIIGLYFAAKEVKESN